MPVSPFLVPPKLNALIPDFYVILAALHSGDTRACENLASSISTGIPYDFAITFDQGQLCDAGENLWHIAFIFIEMCSRRIENCLPRLIKGGQCHSVCCCGRANRINGDFERFENLTEAALHVGHKSIIIISLLVAIICVS